MKAEFGKNCFVWLLLISIQIAFFAITSPVLAQDEIPWAPINIYFFYGDGCPHCAKAKPFLESLADENPGVILNSFEVYYDEKNRELFSQVAEMYQMEQLGVPAIFIGEYNFLGFSEAYKSEIKEFIRQCLEDGCQDLVAPLLLPFTAEVDRLEIPSSVTPSAQPAPTLHSDEQTPAVAPTAQTLRNNEPVDSASLTGQSNGQYKLHLPFNKEITLDVQSITLSTVLIAFVDGFNPCSLWVLSMLLTLTLHTGSRKKVIWIGLIFLTVTSLIYALFIAGLFSVLKFAGFMGWIRIAIALIALFFALVNIKDYFWFKEGLSLTIADEKKPGIYKKMRAVLDAGKSFWGMVGATVMLAVGVSFVEFSCTAGFPVLWSSMVTSQNISDMRFAFLLLLYMVIYQLIAAALFFSAVISFKATRFEEKHGRFLKLLGGVLMLALALVMLIDPAMMNNLSNSLMIFGLAFAVSLVILVVQQSLQRAAMQK